MKLGFFSSLLALPWWASTTTVLAQDDNEFMVDDNQDCYSNTTSILLAQLQDPPILDFVLCPNTIFQIGLPRTKELVDFIDGDVPLMVLHDNVTIVCGNATSPSSQNMCILTGGTIQFLTQPLTPFSPAPVTTHHLKLHGITFESAQTTDAEVPTLWWKAPGTDMIVEDCVFMNLNGDSILSNEGMTPFSSSLTIMDSSFSNIVWTRNVVYNIQQTFHLMGVRMQNMTLSSSSMDNRTLGAPIEIVNGITEIVDSNFMDLEVWTSVVYILDQVDNDMFGYQGNTAMDITIMDLEVRDPLTYCVEGVLVDMQSINGTQQVQCLALFDDMPLSPDGPSTNASNTVLIMTDQCSICGMSGILVNPDDPVPFPGPSGNSVTLSCSEIEAGLNLLPPPFDEGNCPAGSRAAQLAGCQCEGVPTAAPVAPTASPSQLPTLPITSVSPTATDPGTNRNPIPGAVQGSGVGRRSILTNVLLGMMMIGTWIWI